MRGLWSSPPRPRACATADALHADALQYDPLFLEADLAIPHLPALRLRLERRVTVARALWLAGHRGDAAETFGRAWSRSEAAFVRLLEIGAEHDAVALVDHNVLSRCLAWHARAAGWRRIERCGSGYLSSTLYARITR